MRKKVMGVVVVASALFTEVFLYKTLPLNTRGVEDILAVYQQDADYGEITIEYPLDETLFTPEMVRPVFRWKE